MSDSLIQRAVVIFDHHMSKHGSQELSEDETLIYHLFACLFLSIKVENRIVGLSFEHFLKQCV